MVSFTRGQTEISLLIVNPRDSIQSVQATGAFFEEDELSQVAAYFNQGDVFVDIGANTGQHSIYFLKLLGASKAIVFEPIPLTCRILKENIALNGLSDVCDTSHLGVGLSDRNSAANFTVNTVNLGGTSLQETGAGSIKTVTGDSALAGQRVDFIKIDTEGFEIKVLLGLKQTISDNRPAIFIEVDKDNVADFEDFIEMQRYKIVWQHDRYRHSSNYLIAPI
ncbi:hypothetical protein XH80_03940 [Bradyrhizobium sp. CCBAU 45384]|nr:hypothetical protein [Bradyrhizobium sp. CCBAU 45384]